MFRTPVQNTGLILLFGTEGWFDVLATAYSSCEACNKASGARCLYLVAVETALVGRVFGQPVLGGIGPRQL
jgi:hypothetical protein